MKEKIKKIKISKSQIITIILAVAFSMIMSLGTSYAADIIFDSKDVGFDNTGTKIQATTVQGAIDELYDAATDYSSMNTRVNGVEETIGDSTLTTNSQTLTGGINELNDQISQYKIYYVKNYSITLASDKSTGELDPSSLTNGVVTKSNLVGFIAQGKGLTSTGLGRTSTGGMFVATNGDANSSIVFNFILFYE